MKKIISFCCSSLFFSSPLLDGKTMPEYIKVTYKDVLVPKKHSFGKDKKMQQAIFTQKLNCGCLKYIM